MKQSEQWIVDGLEETPHGKVARLELPDGHTQVFPIEQLPTGITEGDALEASFEADGVYFQILPAKSQKTYQENETQLLRLNSESKSKDKIAVNEAGEIVL